MKLSPAMICLAIALLNSMPSIVLAQDASYEERSAARRELELAKMELRHYQLVEYPRLRRHLDAEIRLTEAAIRDFKDRLHEYRPFDRFSLGRPLSITIQELRMCLLEAELRLRDLWAERNALVRFHSDDWRELELNLHAARLRLAALEADDDVAMVDAINPQP